MAQKDRKKRDRKKSEKHKKREPSRGAEKMKEKIKDLWRRREPE